MSMNVEIVGKFLSTLPEDDDHPYRTGPWRPQTTEWDADDLTAVEGEIPHDLDGVYLRNTENPLHPALKFYHPFDGDGMVHVVGFRDGKAFYRNRFVRTDGFAAENEAGGPLWPGLAEPVQIAKRDKGWGARTLMKDASSTDVIVHRGIALTSFYQCGDLYRVDPYSGDTLGKEDLERRASRSTGACRRIRRSTTARASCCSSPTARRRRTCATASSTPTTTWCISPTSRCPVRGCRTTWRSPRTTRFSTTFRCSGIPKLLQADVHLPGFHRDMPSRFAVIPRRGGADEIRWFEADPTFVLHFTNAYEDGDEIVLDGFFEGDPSPVDIAHGRQVAEGIPVPRAGRDADPAAPLAVQPRHRSRARGAAVGLHHRVRHDQRRLRRAASTATPMPRRASRPGSCSTGWSSTTCIPEPRNGSPSTTGSTAARRRWRHGVGSTAEDDGYLVTLTTDMNADASYCLVFDAARVADGPVCKLALPERISSGTHSTWAPGSDLRRWREADTAAGAIGL